MRQRMILVAAAVGLLGILCVAVLAAEIPGSLASSRKIVEPKGFKAAAENDSLALFVNGSTTEIAVLDKKTGALWYSNPPDQDERETLARGMARDRLHSQLVISYFTPGDQRQFMTSCADSVAYGQYHIIPIASGVRVEYVMGAQWQEKDRLPLIISKKRMDEVILAHMESEKDKEFILSSYMLVELRKGGTGERMTLPGWDASTVFRDYTVRLLEDSASDARWEPSLDEATKWLIAQLVENRSDIEDRSCLKHEDVSQMVDNPTYILMGDTTDWDREDIASLLAAAGYTADDVVRDHMENHYDPPKPNPRTFSLVIEYVLDGENLIVQVPCSELEYPIDIVNDEGEKETYPVESISILEFFGAAGQGQDGYMFVPDGSGALVRLNNGKTRFSAVDLTLYGMDQAIMPLDESSAPPQACIPVFGIVANGRAMMAIIESGDAMARIKADVSGRANCYNSVSSSFTVIPKGTVSLSGSGRNISAELKNREVNIYQVRPYQSDICIRYSFLGGSDASYVGMAKCYRDYLRDECGLEKLEPKDDTTFILELVGAARIRKPILGIPTDVVVPLTTCSQAAEVIEALESAGVSEIKMKYTGWFLGGVEHSYPSRVCIDKAVGGASGFAELRDFLGSKGIGLYPDAAFLTVYRSRLFDGFRVGRDGARYLTRRTARIWDYNPATAQRKPGTGRYLLSPARLGSVVSKFNRDYGKLGVGGVSLRDLGRQLYADYREKPDTLVDRGQAKDLITAQVARFAEEYEVMLDGANAYALPYAACAVNLPLDAGGGNIVDESVPFLQIALHGYVEYAGEPINLATDCRHAMLRTIETGACPYYKLMYAPSSALVGTEFNYMYSVGWSDWADHASEFYRRCNVALHGCGGVEITDHERLAPGVYRTTYSNGRYVIVNYTKEDVIVESCVVGAEDFIAGQAY
ncbi:MAG TPA: DUF5696 domain-containing protein [Bacillota bacterium]|nr:DUF5696 domain-containing protein [Bacillota bacterium]